MTAILGLLDALKRRLDTEGVNYMQLSSLV